MMPCKMSGWSDPQKSSLEGGSHGAEIAVAAQHDGDVVAGAADGRVHAALQAQQVRQRVVLPGACLRSTSAAQKDCRLAGYVLGPGLSQVSWRIMVS